MKRDFYGTCAMVLVYGLFWLLFASTGLFSRPVCVEPGELAEVRRLLYAGMEHESIMALTEEEYNKIEPSMDLLWQAVNRLETLRREQC